MKVQSRGVLVGGVLILSAFVGACTEPLEPTPLPPEPVRTHGTPSQLTLTATLGTGTQGGHATLALRVVDAFSTPVKDVTVSLEPSIGTVEPAALTTDENGRGTATLSAPAGSVKVTATIANGPTTSTLVAMQPPLVEPNPTPNPPPPNATPGSLSVQLSATPVQLGTSTSFSLLVSGGGTVQAVAWTFGDGATFAGVSTGTAHLYAAIGSYTASVTVTDTTGRTASGSTTAVVTAAPPPPPPPPPAMTVVLTASPTSVTVGGTSTLTATVTVSNGATTPTGYVFDCDGNGSVDATPATPSTVCTYPTVGTLTATVTVTGSNTAGSATTTVTVTPVPPDPTPVVTVNCAQAAAPPLTLHCVVSATLSGANVPSPDISGVIWDSGATGATTTAVGNEANHTYTGPSPAYTVVASNVTVPGTTKKGMGSTTIKVVVP